MQTTEKDPHARHSKPKIQYADDDTEPVKFLLRLRLPSLIIGLFLGIGLSFITSGFEEVLIKNISVAFFIPFIVYMTAAVGAQTQNIYIRDLKSGKASFKKYLLKEGLLGLVLGLIFAIATYLFIAFGFKAGNVALAASLSIFCTIATAPLIALIITEILELEHTDPAVGAGPIVTVIQDTISIVIYGLIASAVIL